MILQTIWLLLFLIWNKKTYQKSSTIQLAITIPITNDDTHNINPFGSYAVSTTYIAMQKIKLEFKQKYNITVLYKIIDTKHNYGKTVGYVMDLLENGLQNKPLHAIIGSTDNLRSQSIAHMCNEYNIFQMSYGANDPFLSSSTEFPYFTRIFPSAAYEAYALADIIGNTFGWERVAVVYTNGNYGSILLTFFNYRAAQLNIKIVESIKIVPSILTDMKYQNQIFENVKRIKETLDLRIWVFFMDDIQKFQEFLYISRDLFTKNTYILSNSIITDDALFDNSKLNIQQINNIMTGYIGIKPAISDWIFTPSGEQFLHDLQNYNSPTNTSCDSIKDDGGTSVFQAELSNGSIYCIAKDFSKISLHQIFENSLIGYIYDSINYLAYDILQYSINNTNSIIPTIIKGGDLIDWTINKMPIFSGITGNIKLYNGDPGLGSYGFGDRQIGIRFAIMNYYMKNEIMGFRRVGTWTENQFLLCNQTKWTNYTSGCGPILWGTLNNMIPKDHPDLYVKIMPNEIKQFVNFMGGFVICITTGTIAIFIYYHNTRLLKIAQLPILFIILGSFYFASIRILLSAINITESSCIAEYWIGHLAFTSIMAFLAKIWRVHLIMNAKTIKKIRITTLQIIGVIGCFSSISIVFMTFLSALNPFIIDYDLNISITGQPIYDYHCESKNVKLDWFLYSYEILLLLISTKLCYDTRRLPDAINETKSIFRVIFFILIDSAIAFTITNILKFDTWIDELTIAVAFFAASISVFYYYFFPKVWLLLNGADIDKNFKIYYPNPKVFLTPEESNILKQKIENIEQEHNVKIDKYLLKIPKTIVECNTIIQLLEKQVAIILEKNTYDSSSGIESNTNSKIGLEREKVSSIKVYRSQRGSMSKENVSTRKGDVENSIINLSHNFASESKLLPQNTPNLEKHTILHTPPVRSRRNSLTNENYTIDSHNKHIETMYNEHIMHDITIKDLSNVLENYSHNNHHKDVRIHDPLYTIDENK